MNRSLWVLLSGLPALAPAAWADAPHVTEQLIVFVQPGASDVARDFESNALPAIRKLAGDMGIPLHVVDAGRGAPEEVTITPLLVYQNHRGRAVYQGRYNTIDRVRNFLRTARRIPQAPVPLRRTDMPALHVERARMAAPLMVSGVTGTPPKHDPAEFQREARRAIARGLNRFRPAEMIDLRRADRQFYMDVNPWSAEDGTLYVSVALYSQFHCKEPVFTQPGEAIVGPWKDRVRLLARAGEALETAAMRHIQLPGSGDGFDVVKSDVPTVTWEALGLPLPSPPAGAVLAGQSNDQATIPFPMRWSMIVPDPTVDADAPPALQFRFPAPLDGYAGEVSGVRGELVFLEGGSPTVSGFFEANPRSVTMGEPDLDDALRGATFLDVERHPASRFTLKGWSIEPPRPAWGEMAIGVMEGQFEMKGVTIPLGAKMELEPVIDDDGRPRLLLRGAFDIRLQPFGIVGPDGPAPQNDTLVFDYEFALKPAE